MPRIELINVSKRWGNFIGVDHLNMVIEEAIENNKSNNETSKATKEVINNLNNIVEQLIS